MIKKMFWAAALLSANVAGAVTQPSALRNDTPGTGNFASFTSDNLFGNFDTDPMAAGNQAGFVANRYNLEPSGASNNAVTPLERAVVEFRSGGAVQGSSNRTYGFHVPTEASGLPISAGGSGVASSLTNFASVNANTSTVSTTDQINVPWTNFMQSNGLDVVNAPPPPVMFSITRSNNIMTLRIGDGSSTAQWDHSWSTSSSGFADVNAFQLRMASGGSSAWRLTELRFNGSLLNSTINSSPTSLYQSDNITGNPFTNREIFLWDNVSGNFSLTGRLLLGWTNTAPVNSTANLQIKFLSIPGGGDPIPEPASWAMLIAGFGLVGSSLRLRRQGIA
ncbi:PEPxxWA-CTERM sorting domain-containing protein [Sandarakinorhabdus sp.]|uniref:PEPxxWA-CTERM sorting domain-containing protein n=1 Tax=Sandarakinorhabdus sp. TaxID=1916663 RepID=UPI00333E32F5